MPEMPKLGKIIYILDRVEGQIIRERVEYIGKDTFLISGWQMSRKPSYSLAEKNYTWFDTRREAESECKKMMLSKYNERVIRFEPNSTNSWWNPITDVVK